MLRDSVEKYGVVSRSLHWLMALLVVWQLLKLADYINDGQNWVSQTLVKPYHSSIGLLLMLLIVLRLIWVFRQVQRPQPLAFARLAKAGHHLLYTLLFLVPASAICLMLGKGYGLRFFSYSLVERGAGKSELLAAIGSWHAPLAVLLAVVVAGHLAMVAFHQWVKKDATLQRML